MKEAEYAIPLKILASGNCMSDPIYYGIISNCIVLMNNRNLILMEGDFKLPCQITEGVRNYYSDPSKRDYKNPAHAKIDFFRDSGCSSDS